MNPWALWTPTIIVVVSVIFTYGKQSQKQTDHAKRLDGHDEHFVQHGEHLNRIDLALVRLEEYNRGFADATRLGAK